MYKIKRVSMIILFILIAVIIFSSCGDDPKTSQSSGSSSSGNTSPIINSNLKVPDPVVDFCVRSEAVKITDSGRAKQHMDVVYLSEKMDVKALATAGYSTLKVKISLEVREIDDGYQWIFLYSNSSCSTMAILDSIVEFVAGVKVKDDPSMLCGKRFEHGSNKKNTSWGLHSFEFNVPMKDLSKDLYIRFGASGNFDDDWQNRNLYISYQVVR